MYGVRTAPIYTRMLTHSRLPILTFMQQQQTTRTLSLEEGKALLVSILMLARSALFGMPCLSPHSLYFVLQRAPA